MKTLLALLVSFFVAGCSVVGQSGVESAPYQLLLSDESQNIELRNYESMILVSTPMVDGETSSAFRKLFNYITGDNEGSVEIAMTAPVMMNDENASAKGTEIAMTAPVFMSARTDAPMMSFVMPKDFTLATTPKPSNPDVKISQLNNYKVAAIQFSWTLSESNVQEHTAILMQWMNENGHTAAGKPVKAGYNGPLTLPWFRKNEVLIELAP